MTKYVEIQPGSPNFDGAENHELWEDALDRAYAKIHELENKLNKDLTPAMEYAGMDEARWKQGIPPDKKPVLAVTIRDVVGSTIKQCRQIVRAQYFHHKEMESESWDDNEGNEWYCEEDDTYYIKEGWHEAIDYHVDYGYSAIDDPVIAWCELPELPEN